ncbi:MAG: Fis family transcriptional regulator [Pseudonocardia sp.]|nr:Fis family transcriptional regulator [Pseudonocardia sp.]
MVAPDPSAPDPPRATQSGRTGSRRAYPLQAFACAGAPVHDPFTGRIQGVLDISCLSDDSTPIMHSLVRSAAAEIEHNLLTDRNQLQQALFDVYSRVDARSRDAVLAVGPRVSMTNPALQTMLVGADRDALQDHVRFVMQRHPSVDDCLDLPSGLRVRLRGSTISVGRDVAGMVGVVSLLDEKSGDDRRVVSGRRAAAELNGAGFGRIQERLVQGSSPAWRSAANTVKAALAAGDPVLVLGEPGAGRFTLLAELHRATVTSIEPDTVEAAPQITAAQVIEPGATLRVLRDIDRLTPGAADALADSLTDVGGEDRLRVAGTATDAGREDAPFQRLLSLFRASATVPPLRNRSTDVPALVTALLADLVPHRDVRLSAAALRVLARHPWPGNVRELRDALAYALRRRPVGRIEPEDLPACCQSTPCGALREVDRTERDTIVAALRETGGNRVAAAAVLGLARSTLYRKIRQYGITA